MSFWSDIVGSIKTLIQNENENQDIDIRWLNVETKFFQLISVLKEKNEKQGKAIIPSLAEINLILEKKNIIMDNDFAVFFRVRSIFLELWRLLLDELNLLLNNQNPSKNHFHFSSIDISAIQKTIGYFFFKFLNNI